jgi:dimethylargininase
MLIAVTRPVSASLARCELTHLERQPIDVARAEAQHAEYERRLGELGATVLRAPAAHDLPDAVFIEDTAVVLDELAILTRPGAPTRRDEIAPVAEILARFRPLQSLEPPATLDGGDVLRLGRTLHVGRSERTNAAGIEALERMTAPFGYRVEPVAFSGCLHLKSAVTELAESLLLVHPGWVSAAAFPRHETIAIDEREPYAANALRVGDRVLYPSQYPRTRERLAGRGLSVSCVDSTELAKAEGALTCCSLLFEVSASSPGGGSAELRRRESG